MADYYRNKVDPYWDYSPKPFKFPAPEVMRDFYRNKMDPYADYDRENPWAQDKERWYPQLSQQHTASSVFDLWEQWKNSSGETHRGGDSDYEAFAHQFGVGQRAIEKLRQQHASVSVNKYLAWCNRHQLRAGHKRNLDWYGRNIAASERKRLARALKASQHDYDPDNSDQIFAPSQGHGWEHGSGPSGPPYTRPQGKGKHPHEAHTRRATEDWVEDPTDMGEAFGTHTKPNDFQEQLNNSGMPVFKQEPNMFGGGATLTGSWNRLSRWLDARQVRTAGSFEDWAREKGYPTDTPPSEDVRMHWHYDTGTGAPEDWEGVPKEWGPHGGYRPHHGNRKTAWSGWGPSVFPRTREVTGWKWDTHLEGYLANRPQRFACSCGSDFATPTGFHRCACGKQWNSYVIGTGGNNREAAAEKYLVREIPIRDNVIVAGKQGKIYKLDEPGELDEGEEDGLPTIVTPPKDWAKRDRNQRWTSPAVG